VFLYTIHQIKQILFVRALMFCNKVLHMTHIAILLIEYCQGYLAPGRRWAQQSSACKHAPVISKFMSGPKEVHISVVHCTTEG